MVGRLALVAAALAVAARAADADCERFAGAPASGVLPTLQGGYLAFIQEASDAHEDATTLRLKGVLARHLTGGRDDLRVVLQGAVRWPSLACEGRTVHQLLVAQAEVALMPSAATYAPDPRATIAALEAARAARPLDRPELERLRHLYWSVGETGKAQEVARALFGAR